MVVKFQGKDLDLLSILVRFVIEWWKTFNLGIFVNDGFSHRRFI